jgi:hypothetical protein
MKILVLTLIIASVFAMLSDGAPTNGTIVEIFSKEFAQA